MRISHNAYILMAALLLTSSLPAGRAASPSTPPLPDVVDDGAYYEALRQRGLREWSQQARDDVSPGDSVASVLARRETLLEQAANSDRPVEQARAAVTQAADLLRRLIADYGDQPGAFRWRFELARDYLERLQPEAFEAMLLYELPGPGALMARDLAGHAIETLTALRGQISSAWKSVELLDEQGLSAARTTGSLASLEVLDAQSSMLLTWARLYAALADRMAGGAAADAKLSGFTEVLDEVTKSGWLNLPPGRESEQAGALVIAAIAERHLGRAKEADGHARQVIELLNRVSDSSVRQRLRRTTLLAVLEQIRSTRDAGQFDAALAAVQQARQWCIKSRPDDASALVAVSILECHVCLCKQETRVSEVRASVGSWLRAADCMKSLDLLARKSPACRDLLYAVLSQSLTSPPESVADVFARQLWIGAAVADAQAAMSVGRGADVSRLEVATKLAQEATALPYVGQDAQMVGELHYLLGQALALKQARTEAVQIFANLAEKMPTHDRADAAVRRAVNLAAQDVRQSGTSGSPGARSNFIRAARILRQRDPDEARVPDLTYAIGVALENGEHYEEAAEEYAKIPPEHAYWLDAALGRVRCWRQALEATSALGAGAGGDGSKLVDRALSAGRAIQERVGIELTASNRTANRSDRCGIAKLIVSLGELFNQPAVGNSQQTMTILQDFEKRFPNCEDLVGSVLRQRILALRQLKRLQEARAVLDRYITADPDNAGSAMASLLQALHDEMLEGLKRGDKKAAAASAAEALPLGRSLLDWVAEHSGRMTPANVLVTRLWYASALLQAGRAAEALAEYESAERQDEVIKSTDAATRTELQLGRADALLTLDRVTEALPTYERIWSRSIEGSDTWWHALTGSLCCHARDPKQVQQVLQSIRQQRFLFPEFDGGRYKHELIELERLLIQPRAGGE